jgi:hypothetical protein
MLARTTSRFFKPVEGGLATGVTLGLSKTDGSKPKLGDLQSEINVGDTLIRYGEALFGLRTRRHRAGTPVLTAADVVGAGTAKKETPG